MDRGASVKVGRGDGAVEVTGCDVTVGVRVDVGV